MLETSPPPPRLGLAGSQRRPRASTIKAAPSSNQEGAVGDVEKSVIVVELDTYEVGVRVDRQARDPEQPARPLRGGDAPSRRNIRPAEAAARHPPLSMPVIDTRAKVHATVLEPRRFQSDVDH